MVRGEVSGEANVWSNVFHGNECWHALVNGDCRTAVLEDVCQLCWPSPAGFFLPIWKFVDVNLHARFKVLQALLVLSCVVSSSNALFNNGFQDILL